MSWRWKIAQWFELQWWKNYLRDKKKEDYLLWKRNYWKDILSKISLDVESSKTIGDLGCGPAGVFIALAENNITAVDPLINDYENSISFFNKSDYPNTTFIQSKLEDFSVAEKLDFVFCMNAINHVHDIEKGFDMLVSCCKEEGTIVTSIDAHNFSFFKYLFRILPGDILHPHQYDLNEYKTFLENRKAKILKTELLKAEFLFNHYLIVAQKE